MMLAGQGDHEIWRHDEPMLVEAMASPFQVTPADKCVDFITNFDVSSMGSEDYIDPMCSGGSDPAALHCCLLPGHR